MKERQLQITSYKKVRSLLSNLDVVLGVQLTVNSVQHFVNFHSVPSLCKPYNLKEQVVIVI